MPRAKSRRRSLKNDARARTQPKTPPAADRDRRPEYLTPIEVANRLLVKVVTVRLWASKGLLPSVTTLGGHRRFRVEDVDGFVARHQQVKPGHRKPVSRVLIIDDDRQFSRYLAGVIATQAAHAVVDVAHDGFSAGIKFEAIRPDVVTLDLQIPDMDGFEVCAMLRSKFGRKKPRIVALTAFASAGNIERIIAAGADSCIAKTASADILLREMGLTRADEI